MSRGEVCIVNNSCDDQKYESPPLRFSTPHQARDYLGYRKGQSIPLYLEATLWYITAPGHSGPLKKPVRLSYDPELQVVVLRTHNNFHLRYFLTGKADDRQGLLTPTFEFVSEGGTGVIQVQFHGEGSAD